MGNFKITVSERTAAPGEGKAPVTECIINNAPVTECIFIESPVTECIFIDPSASERQVTECIDLSSPERLPGRSSGAGPSDEPAHGSISPLSE